MKKFLLTSLMLVSVSTMANGWSSLTFPEKNPEYQSVSKRDINGQAQLNFSCTDSNKEIILLTLSNVNIENETGIFFFQSSKKDKYPTDIKGSFKKSKDGTINLITGFSKKEIMYDLKKLLGVNLILMSNSGEQLETFNYSLKGSSKNLSILENRCNKL